MSGRLRRVIARPSMKRQGVWVLAGLLVFAASGGVAVGAVLGAGSVHAKTRVVEHRVAAPAPAGDLTGGKVHSVTGASTAAHDIDRYLGDPQIMNPKWRRHLLGVIAAPDARARLDQQWSDGMRLVDAGTRMVSSVAHRHPTIGFTQPIAWKAGAYSARQADVEVWSINVLGGVDGYAPTSSWTTTTYTLQWSGDRGWLLEGSAVKDGPTPVASPGNPTAAPDLIAAYDGMTRYMP